METDKRQAASQTDLPGSAKEVFLAFLSLGLTSFGGPVAHLGYFRQAFVIDRKWIGEDAYADLVALCQFLPGPASSQVGMAIGLQRAGYAGLFAAWAGFTLPSAILIVAVAGGVAAFDLLTSTGLLEGLKAAAAGVVAHAVLGMASSLTPDRERASVAAIALTVALLQPTAAGQIAAILLGGVIGALWLKPALRHQAVPRGHPPTPGNRKVAVALLVVFAALLFALPILAAVSGNPLIAMIDSFYRTGSLVFGGGHVVLPLLQAEVVATGQVGEQAFLAGYGIAQALPGPLFSFAAYLGANYQTTPTGITGATVALASIYLPSVLLVAGVLPFWERLRGAPLARRALLGVNAAVVGLLAAALYDPVFKSGVTSALAMAIACACFVALAAWKVPAWAVVIAAGLAGFLFL